MSLLLILRVCLLLVVMHLDTRPRDYYSAPDFEAEEDGEYVRAGNVDGAPKFISLQFTHLLSMRAL